MTLGEPSEAEPEVTNELKQSLIDGPGIEHKLGLAELEGDDWKTKIIQTAELRAMKASAKANSVAQTEQKQEIFDRIIEKLFE